MPGSYETPRTTSSVLKTTTWGALIALSGAIFVAGVLGYNPWTHSRDLGRPYAQVGEQAPPLAAHPRTPSQDGSFKGEAPGRAVSSHAKSTPTVTATPVISAAATREIPIGSNQADLGHSSVPINEIGTHSASASPNDDQSVVVAKIAPDLKGVDPEASIDVIVQFKNDATDLTADGATAKSDLPLIHAQLVNVKGGSLSSLASHSGVAYISPDRPVAGALDDVVTAVNGDLAFAGGWNGKGIGIAVIDSGVGSAYDLNTDDNQSSRISYNESFVPGDFSSGDAFGHGTHISGIIAGNAYTSSTSYYPGVYRGIAPEAKIINLRALDSNGAGTVSSVISAIQAAIRLKNTYNIRVINLSLARGVYESYTLDPLCQAVESAWRAGIVVVAAAGNMGQYNGAGTNGYATIGAPGNEPYVITVGATNTHGTGSQAAQTMTSYSSKGPTSFDHIVKPDLMAPGNRVVSRIGSQGNSLVASYPELAVCPCNSSRTSCGATYGSARYMRLSGTIIAWRRQWLAASRLSCCRRPPHSRPIR